MIKTDFKVRTEHVLIVLGVGVVAWVARQGFVEAKAAAGRVGKAVNPVDRENVFHRGVNSVGAVLSGDKDFTLGGWIFDLTHPDAGKVINSQPDHRTLVNDRNEGIAE